LPISDKPLRDPIYDWILAETGLESVWRDQNAPKIDNPHFVLAFDSFIDMHEPYSHRVDDDTTELEGSTEFTLLILGFGELIIEKTRALRNSLKKAGVKQTLRTGRIVVWDTLPVVNLSGLFNTKYEERSSCDIMLRTDYIITDSVGIIEEIKDIKVTAKQSGKPDKIETFTVDSTP